MIGMTLGDPAGIGPELVARVLAGEPAEVAVYGDRGVIEAAAARVGVPPPKQIVEVTRLGEVVPGRPTDATGRAQIDYLEAAIADAKAGKLDALVTAPIHKGAVHAAGFAYPGHTELLAARFAPEGAPPLAVTMMFAGPRMRVSLATIHEPLAEVPRRLTTDGIAGTIVRTARALAGWFGIARPRVHVAGLNPHAGEAGQFGDEEARVIAPAIEAARRVLQADGLSAEVSGPRVPDAVFRDHLDGRSDAVVALYHDQGLIPVKLVDFEEAVNLTVGLPIVRTSPDHGVAYDLAGTGRARPESLKAALALAIRLAQT